MYLHVFLPMSDIAQKLTAAESITGGISPHAKETVKASRPNISVCGVARDASNDLALTFSQS